MASGGSEPTQQNVTTTTSNLPEYAAPYFKNLMSRAEAWSNKPYEAYPYERIAGFTDAQKQLQSNILGMQAPKQFADASGLASAAGLGSLRAANFAPTQFTAQQVGLPELQQYRMQDTGDVVAGNYNAPQMQAAQTRFTPELTAYQMAGPGDVQAAEFDPVRDVVAREYRAPQMQGAQSQWQANLERFQMVAPDQFTGDTASQYMSPYMRNVLDVQKREAQTDARKAQLAQDLGAARQGTYGGARQLLATTERERALGQQLGDIEARGMQGAFENAQSQFERDRAATMAAQQTNLQAALGVQELGANTGIQMALANLSNEQQGRVQNMAAQLQTQGMNAENAMRAALANQGVDVTRSQANMQAQMQAQLANQQARQQAEQANLQSKLGVQQLGTQTGLQAALANLDAASQANVQNLAAQLQTQGMNADQALRAALANQQSRLSVGQANLQAGLGTQQLGVQSGLQALMANQQQALEAQRLAEQSKQFGAQNQLAAFGQAGQMAQTMGNLGQYQQQADLQRLQAQQGAAGQAQALEQQYLDQYYADFLRQRDADMERLGYASNILRGLPVGLNTTNITYAPSPSMASQVLGTGLGALGMYNTLRG